MPNDVKIMDNVDVPTTLSLSASLLKKRKKAVSIPQAKMTLKIANQENIMDTFPYTPTAKTSVYNGTNKKVSIRGKTVANP